MTGRKNRRMRFLPKRAADLDTIVPGLVEMRLDSSRGCLSEAVSTVLAAEWLPPTGVSSPGTLRKYIEQSRSSRAYFDALERIWEELDNRGSPSPTRSPGGEGRLPADAGSVPT